MAIALSVISRESSLQESEAITLSWQGSQLIVTEGLGHNRILRVSERIKRSS